MLTTSRRLARTIWSRARVSPSPIRRASERSSSAQQQCRFVDLAEVRFQRGLNGSVAGGGAGVGVASLCHGLAVTSTEMEVAGPGSAADVLQHHRRGRHSVICSVVHKLRRTTRNDRCTAAREQWQRQSPCPQPTPPAERSFGGASSDVRAIRRSERIGLDQRAGFTQTALEVLRWLRSTRRAPVGVRLGTTGLVLFRPFDAFAGQDRSSGRPCRRAGS